MCVGMHSCHGQEASTRELMPRSSVDGVLSSAPGDIHSFRLIVPRTVLSAMRRVSALYVCVVRGIKYKRLNWPGL